MNIHKHTSRFEPKFKAISLIEGFEIFFRKSTNRRIIGEKPISLDSFVSVKNSVKHITLFQRVQVNRLFSLFNVLAKKIANIFLLALQAHKTFINLV